MVSRFEQFCASVSSIYYDIQKIERVEMAKYGLKGPHAQCLIAMKRFPEGITAGELCAACEKDKAAISRTLAQLEKEGLVERADPDGSRYRSLLRLTARGMEAAQQVDARAELAVETAGAGMTDAQRELLYDALARIAGKLQVISSLGLQEENDTTFGGNV